MNRVTLRDVAAAAGVSHATVSMALRNHPATAEKTRKLVQEVAERLGYQPDPMLSSLAYYRQGKRPPTDHGTLAWVNAHPEPEKLYRDRLFREYLEGSKEQAARHGYKIEEFKLKELSINRLCSVLRARGIQGILLPPQPKPDMDLQHDFSGFAAVTFGFSLKAPKVHRVCSAQQQCAILALDNLFRLGYRRIGFLTGRDQEERVGFNFLSGYLARIAPVPQDEQCPIFWSPSDLSLTEKAMLDWYQKNKPDVVFGLASPVFFEVMKKAGVRVPEDVAVVSLDWTPEKPFFGGIDQRGVAVGAAAVDMLTVSIQTGEWGRPEVPRYLLIEGRWQDGASVPPRS